MTIFTREQIDAIERYGEYGPDPDLIDTARAYHDLRDAVLALPIRNYFTEDGIYRGACVDRDALVALVERGGRSGQPGADEDGFGGDAPEPYTGPWLVERSE